MSLEDKENEYCRLLLNLNRLITSGNKDTVEADKIHEQMNEIYCTLSDQNQEKFARLTDGVDKWKIKWVDGPV